MSLLKNNEYKKELITTCFKSKDYIDNEIRPLINIGVETCQELGQRGVSKSGIYPIDPDGQDQNESPIQGNLLRGIVNFSGVA